jgi:hypothetical protein
MFCSLADVKAHHNTNEGYQGDDDLLTTHIKTATALIRQFTRRSWEQGTYTQFFSTQDINVAIRRGDAVARFSIKEKPLQSITQVIFNTGGAWDDTSPLPSNAYEVDTNANSLIIYPQRMVSHTRSLRVRYVAGFPINNSDPQILDVSENIKQACAQQAAMSFRRMLNENAGASLKQDRKGLTQYKVGPSGLFLEAQALLRGEVSILVGGNG